MALPYVERAIGLARDGIKQTRHLLQQLRNKKNKPAPINLVDALRHSKAKRIAVLLACDPDYLPCKPKNPEKPASRMHSVFWASVLPV